MQCNQCQINLVLCVTKSGKYLPPQLIYAGKTSKCILIVNFPSDWHVTCTQNRWENEVTMCTLQYIDKILLPYVNKTRKGLSFPISHSCLVIFERFKAQFTPTVLQALKENHIPVALVPAKCMNRLQPLDISINKSVKQFLRGEFHDWYASQTCSQIHTNEKIQPVYLHLTIVKPLGAAWIIWL